MSVFFPENVSPIGFFAFDRSIIRDQYWAKLSMASKAVFPAIFIHANSAGSCNPSRKRIAALAGVTEKTVTAGIEGLKSLAQFTVAKRAINSRGVRGNLFNLRLPNFKTKGRAFPFHQAIILGGNWANLTPSAKSLYPVLRHLAFYDHNTGQTEWDNSDFGERLFDSCEADQSVMAEYAGISTWTVRDALDSLRENFLLESPGDGEIGWRIYLRPIHFFDSNDLNRIASRRLRRG